MKCDMVTFLEIVLPLHRSEPDTNTGLKQARFNPDVLAFQNPSRATDNLSVDFSNMTVLLRWINVNDVRDQRVFATKFSTKRPGGMLRILGTSCFLTVRKESSDTVGVDCVLPFVSCTSSQQSQLQDLLSSNPDGDITVPPASTYTGLQTDVVFYRYRENYDPSQGRYISPWRARRITWSYFTRSNSPSDMKSSTVATLGVSSQDTSDTDGTFSVQWSRCAPLSRSQWTDDATFMGSLVLGSMTLFFPSVIFFGPSTLYEIEALMHKYFH